MDFLHNVSSVRFVDAHVHLKNCRAFEQIRESGIAAVRNAGMRDNSLEDRASRKRCQGDPAVIDARWALYKNGGYGSQFGVPVTTRDDIKTEIGKLKAAGADIVKVMASGIVSLEKKETITPGGFSEAELSFIVEESAKCDLKVMAHANGEAAVISSVRAGVLSVEHGFYMSEKALEALASAGVFWVPTTSALVRAARAASLSEAIKRSICSVADAHLNMIRTAHRLGVGLAVGTDCVLPATDYRAAYEEEMGYFVKAGLDRETVLAIASEGGAKLLGR